jgi:hypothetical protein
LKQPHHHIKQPTTPSQIGSSYECDESELPFLNDLSLLEKYLSCKGLEFGYEADTPSLIVSEDHPKRGICLISAERIPTCEGKSKDTRRICPCRNKS